MDPMVVSLLDSLRLRVARLEEVHDDSRPNLKMAEFFDAKGAADKLYEMACRAWANARGKGLSGESLKQEVKDAVHNYMVEVFNKSVGAMNLQEMVEVFTKSELQMPKFFSSLVKKDSYTRLRHQIFLKTIVMELYREIISGTGLRMEFMERIKTNVKAWFDKSLKDRIFSIFHNPPQDLKEDFKNNLADAIVSQANQEWVVINDMHIIFPNSKTENLDTFLMYTDQFVECMRELVLIAGGGEVGAKKKKTDLNYREVREFIRPERYERDLPKHAGESEDRKRCLAESRMWVVFDSKHAPQAAVIAGFDHPYDWPGWHDDSDDDLSDDGSVSSKFLKAYSSFKKVPEADAGSVSSKFLKAYGVFQKEPEADATVLVKRFNTLEEQAKLNQFLGSDDLITVLRDMFGRQSYIPMSGYVRDKTVDDDDWDDWEYEPV